MTTNANAPATASAPTAETVTVTVENQSKSIELREDVGALFERGSVQEQERRLIAQGRLVRTKKDHPWIKRSSGAWTSLDRTGPYPAWGDIDALCNLVVDLTRQLADAQATIARLKDFARDVATNYDHDADAHRYNTGCRTCSAEKELAALAPSQEGTPDA